MSSFRRPVGARLGTAVVAVLVLLCQATASVHEAATPHVTCVEHGEQVHLVAGATPRHQGQGLDVGFDVGFDVGLDVDATPAESVAHAHEHCGLQGQRSTTTPTPTRTFVTARHVTSPEPAVANVGPIEQLLRLAPKTSPPGTPAV